ncbi:cation diffusion facilitator family transporter [Thiomicrorhabdus sediminis]|uniref:Cation-efflux pump FieF n=1 Tax=Thiomicrorhabdus sediminis TaxID=2580412 RepID=A0A4P9K2Q0_9GAMM|nr:cation diffusion facilitator family transporter [Thiomicrorhabdus sediminis]QCU89124.1 cation diffusion facilitator family transporter [Thiomicrorhabdus sediminis]
MKKAKLIRIATYASVLVAVLLLLLKTYAWWQTDSVSILASLLDSGLDIAASVMIAFAVYIAQQPADNEHRFGHGKAEPLASLAQSVFIGGSAVYLILYSIERLWNPQEIIDIDLGLLVMSISLLVTIVLVLFQRYVIRQTQSTAIEADSLHYLSDVLANILIIVSLLLSAYQWLDPILAILIGVWILYSAFGLGKKAGNQLLDHELPETVRQQIRTIVLATPGVQGMNDLRTYRSGPNSFVQFDLELNDHLTLVESHNIAEKVTNRLLAEFDDMDVMIHQEPVSLRHDEAHHNWGHEIQ